MLRGAEQNGRRKKKGKKVFGFKWNAELGQSQVAACLFSLVLYREIGNLTLVGFGTGTECHRYVLWWNCLLDTGSWPPPLQPSLHFLKICSFDKIHISILLGLTQRYWKRNHIVDLLAHELIPLETSRLMCSRLWLWLWKSMRIFKKETANGSQQKGSHTAYQVLNKNNYCK